MGSLSPPSLVQTPEHVLAAALLLDLDTLSIRFFGGEAPIVDGSAQPFLDAMLAAGIEGGEGASRLRLDLSWEGQRLCWTGGLWPARARTFIDRDEAQKGRQEGLFPGAMPGCALVRSDRGASLYGGRPRLPAEPASHKMLDLLGDLAPLRAQGPLHGQLEVHEPGHHRNGLAIRRALASGALTVERRQHRDP